MYTTPMFELFESVAETEKTAAIHKIIDSASPRRDFFLLVILSVSMASFGVLIDSAVILIGSMLIAPILYPLLSLSLGLTTVDEKLVTRSLFTLVKASAFAIAASAIIGILFSAGDVTQYGVIGDLAHGGPSLIYAVIAGISGFAAAFALVKPHLSDMLPGVAISVSLVPPLAIVGVALASLDFAVAINAFLLYLVNVVGVVLCAMFVFVMLKLSAKQEVVTTAVQKDEEEVAAEHTK